MTVKELVEKFERENLFVHLDIIIWNRAEHTHDYYNNVNEKTRNALVKKYSTMKTENCFYADIDI